MLPEAQSQRQLHSGENLQGFGQRLQMGSKKKKVDIESPVQEKGEANECIWLMIFREE